MNIGIVSENGKKLYTKGTNGTKKISLALVKLLSYETCGEGPMSLKPTKFQICPLRLPVLRLTIMHQTRPFVLILSDVL